MSKFTNLEITVTYDIIDAESGHPITEGIQGADAMSQDWADNAEAWPAGETKFAGQPVENNKT